MTNLVSPSILSCDFLNIENELKPFLGQDGLWVHLDIMDGHFVPNLTFGIPIVKKLCQSISLPMDAHLMVSNPEFHLEEMKDFSLANVTFHLEANENPIGLVRQYRSYYKSIGVSIKPKTSLDHLTDELLKEIDLVLVMSVEPGFGGQSFIEGSIERIQWLNQKRSELNTHFQIQVDGGVSDKNAALIRDAGADNLVAGSFVFKVDQNEYLNQVEKIR